MEEMENLEIDPDVFILTKARSFNREGTIFNKCTGTTYEKKINHSLYSIPHRKIHFKITYHLVT